MKGMAEMTLVVYDLIACANYNSRARSLTEYAITFGFFKAEFYEYFLCRI